MSIETTFTYGKWKLAEGRHKGSFWRDRNVLEFDWEGSYIGILVIKIHQIVYLRTVRFPVWLASHLKLNLGGVHLSFTSAPSAPATGSSLIFLEYIQFSSSSVTLAFFPFCPESYLNILNLSFIKISAQIFYSNLLPCLKQALPPGPISNLPCFAFWHCIYFHLQVYYIFPHFVDPPLEFKLHEGRILTCHVYMIQGSEQSLMCYLINACLITIN